jgi:hypothetical protein
VIRISLDAESFRRLVSGERVLGAGDLVEIALQDIGFDTMAAIIQEAHVWRALTSGAAAAEREELANALRISSERLQRSVASPNVEHAEATNTTTNTGLRSQKPPKS